ncbi:HNH endonuclease signature motif containing protein [Blautia obeum]|uniref:HNH endonuclease signature motif containing protein n=1 Tax=Blautia obeum TaxID=40520 RepID=UPI001A9A5C09|nr:HNH endonuclease signature motif containing protein [Blautia obeum]
MWEEHHGEIPKGKMVSFLDGDKDNCNIENLFLIDNETNLEMNRRELRFDEAELTKVGRNIAKLNISARNRKKGKR